jgi:hypothetical protein
VSNIAVALACAFVGFSYRSATYFVLASKYAHEDEVRRRAGVGLRVSSVVSALVAVAFLLIMLIPLRFTSWLTAGLVIGILLEELNTTLWRRKVLRPPTRLGEAGSGEVVRSVFLA